MNIILKIMLRRYRRKLDKEKKKFLHFLRGDSAFREMNGREDFYKYCRDRRNEKISAIDVLLTAETQTTVKKPEA